MVAANQNSANLENNFAEIRDSIKEIIRKSMKELLKELKCSMDEEFNQLKRKFGDLRVYSEKTLTMISELKTTLPDDENDDNSDPVVPDVNDRNVVHTKIGALNPQIHQVFNQLDHPKVNSLLIHDFSSSKLVVSTVERMFNESPERDGYTPTLSPKPPDECGSSSCISLTIRFRATPAFFIVNTWMIPPIFDPGGGTFDVFILEMSNNVFEVKAINENTLLGGEDSDNTLWDVLVSEFKRTENIVVIDEMESFALIFDPGGSQFKNLTLNTSGGRQEESSLVICFGEMLIDFVPTIGGGLLAEAPTFKKIPGDASANVVVISRLGVSSAFIGKVGEDEFGYMLADILKQNKVNNSGMRFNPAAKTRLAFVTLRSDGEREFLFFRNPSADILLHESELDINLIKQATIFHYGSISLIEKPCRSIHLVAMTIAKKSGSILSCDPNMRLTLYQSADAAREGIMSIWEKVDVIKVSEDGILFLTRGDNPNDDNVVLKKLYHPNLKLLLVTEGSEGCRYYTKQFKGRVPGVKVKPVDTTGASDAFVGGILESLAFDMNLYSDEKKLREALLFANACGALTVTEKGAIQVPQWNHIAWKTVKSDYCGKAGVFVFDPGGFCTRSVRVIDHKRLSSSGYVFSASFPPYLASAAITVIDVLEDNPQLVTNLKKNISILSEGLSDVQGLEIVSDYGTSSFPVAAVHRIWIVDIRILNTDRLHEDQHIFMVVATCALAFRILRMNGCDVFSDTSTQIAKEKYYFNFLGEHLEGTGDALELYKESQMSIHPNESVLGKQNSWSSHFLEKKLSNGSVHSDRYSQYIFQEVEDALKFSFHANLERRVNRRNIEQHYADNTRILKTFYFSSNISNTYFQMLAMEDFNGCQFIQSEELKHLERWVVENIMDKLKLTHQKAAYCLFSVAATFSPPELSDARISWVKNDILITAVHTSEAEKNKNQVYFKGNINSLSRGMLKSRKSKSLFT